MKNQLGVLVLAVIALGLLVALIAVKHHSSSQHERDAESILTHSNNWFNTSAKLDEQRQVAAMLEKDKETQKETYEKALTELTNNFTRVSGDLAKTEASLEARLKEVAERDARIAALETQNQQLDKQASDLSTSLTNLTQQIADTEKKLAASEGDKAFLQKELKRLMAEKAELERQFNDLAVLRAQVSKLKEELNIARRIEWIRQGLFASSDQKGAQKLMQGVSARPAPAKASQPAYDLNVEVSADGTVRVLAPKTNAPPGSVPAPK